MGSIAVAISYFTMQALVTQPVMIYLTYTDIVWSVVYWIWPPMLVLIPILMHLVLLEATNTPARLPASEDRARSKN